MDNLVIGLIVVLALAYIGFKMFKQDSGKSSSCGGCCSCDGSNKALGIKRADT